MRKNSCIASVIIITKNQKDFLRKSLPILLSQNLQEQYEIIVVDSGSTDGAIEYIRSLPITLVEIDAKSFNYAYAFNSGAKKAKGTFLIRLSGDCIPIEKNCLQELLRPFEDPKVGATYGKYITTGKKGYTHPAFWPPERFPASITRYSMESSFFLGVINSQQEKEKIFNLAGGFCAILRDIWNQRPFNTRLYEAEDAEYAWFLHLIGYDVVYTPYAKAIHEHKVSTKKNLKRQALWMILFSMELSRYWMFRIIGINPYSNIENASTTRKW